MSVIGIIPARGGSKRFPRKNLAMLAGTPLIAWTIEAGRKSRYLDELLVSTDDREIARIAAELGAAVPFVRPDYLSGDEAATVDVVLHALDHYREKEGREFDVVALLQPTSPLRDAAELGLALELMDRRGADAVISVSETEHSPLWTNTLPPDRSLEGFLRDEVKGKRSQDLPRFYRLNGAIYLCRTSRLLAEQSFFLRDNIVAHLMTREKSVDVDLPLDLKLCELLLRESGNADARF